MSYNPPRPTGDNEEARYHQAIWDRVFGAESVFVETPGVKMQKTAEGKYIPIVKVPSARSSDPERMNFPDTGLTYIDNFPYMKGYYSTWVSGRLYRKNDLVHVAQEVGNDADSVGTFLNFTAGDSPGVWHYFFLWTGEASDSTPQPAFQVSAGSDATPINVGHAVNQDGNDPLNQWVLISKYVDWYPGHEDPANLYPTERQEPYSGFLQVKRADGFATPGATGYQLRIVGGVIQEVTIIP